MIGELGPDLFVGGEFRSHSGLTLPFKIDCDALSSAELTVIRDLIVRRCRFGEVEGVPTGGLRLARALAPFARPGNGLLIVDDVLTTGASMEEHRDGRDALGIVIFARGECPGWVTPILQLDRRFR